jgi:aubergine-like protein
MDDLKARKWLVNQVQSSLGAYIFNGALLYTSTKLDPSPFVFNVEDPRNKETYQGTLKFHRTLETSNPEYLHFYHVLLRKCLFGMGLEELGRHFYDPGSKINLEQQRLQLWPGYITSLRQHETDALLCVETTHKVIRLDNVLDIIRGIEKNVRGDVTQAVQAQLKDSIVLTGYNNKTYRVTDMDYSKNPASVFETRKGPTSFVEYYKSKYSKDIQDLKQPLLIAETRQKDPKTGIRETVRLVPELCQLTGLTDAMRENFTLMRELAKYLHVAPQARSKELTMFMTKLNHKMSNTLNLWGLGFDKKMVGIQGRILPSEKIYWANNQEHLADDKADWTAAFRKQKMLSTVNLERWAVIVPGRDSGGVDNLCKTMSRVSAPLNMRIADPEEVVKLADIRPQSYQSAIDTILKKRKDLQMLFVILPNNKLDLYSVVKKRLAVEVGLPSQCFVAKNVTSKGLMSIATKVVVQMNAKLGGEPWTIKMPVKNTMVVGVDVYHGKGTKGTIFAIVSTLNEHLAKYFSTTTSTNDTGEFSHAVKTDINKCIGAYREENNGLLPQRIMIYRDGVGDGQLKQVFEVELKEILAAIKLTYDTAKENPPKITFIVVTKKINTRILTDFENGTYGNPPPGTVADDVITMPERYDFFLIACTGRQGTVSPCSYNVLYDTSGLKPDQIQLLTYKMCHMYFNWSGTVAVPAPCQYAHKLAQITGMAYQNKANEKLSKLLHFL